MLTDQGSAFTSKSWKDNCDRISIKFRHTGTESHNSLGSGDTYHAMIRVIYNKVSMDYSSSSPQIRLAMIIMAMNDNSGPQGLVPSLLVFGMIPRFISDKTDLPNCKQRMEIMKTARKEYEQIIGERRVQNALNKKVPPAVYFRFIPGQAVYEYREKTFLKWTGPHTLISAEQKNVLVDVDDRQGPRSFKLVQIKALHLPSISSLIT